MTATVEQISLAIEQGTTVTACLADYVRDRRSAIRTGDRVEVEEVRIGGRYNELRARVTGLSGWVRVREVMIHADTQSDAPHQSR